MKQTKIKTASIVIFCTIFSMPAWSAGGDDPWLTKTMSEFTSLQDDGESVLEWDIDFWAGRDLSKFWIKSSGEAVGSEIEDANIEFVYSRAIYTTWDQQFGIRRDLKPNPNSDARSWLSYGYIGTAPYFVAVDARIFVGEESSSQLLIELEKEIMLTQEWVLTPELDITANGRTNEKFGEGSGLSEIEFGLRLGYERNGNRKFQPFVGLTARQSFGRTKDIAKVNGRNSGNFQAMIGIHSWF